MPKKDKQERKPKQMAPRKTKVDRSESKQPDPFMDFTRVLFERIKEYWKPVLAAAAGVVLIFVVLATWQYLSKKKRGEAGAAVSRAVRMSQAPVKELTPSDQLKNLDKELKVYATLEERYKDQVSNYSGVVKNYGGTPAGVMAKLALAVAHFRLGEQPKVESNLKAFLTANAQSPLRWLAEENLGFFYEKAGKTAKAASQYEKLTKSPVMFYQVMGHIYLGNLYAKTNPVKAKGYYSKVVNDAKFKKYFVQTKRGHVRRETQKKLELLTEAK